jgi:phenylacetate-coenzyme A ligase PaaK-like adenylate-forming protein
MSAQAPTAADGPRPASAPISPAHPAPDVDHERRAAAAVARALREIPYYQKRWPALARTVDPALPLAPLSALLARLPLLHKKEVAATLPRQWVPAGTDVRAELESGALELVETSGSTGDRLRVLWDAGWWMRQETRAMRTNGRVAAAMDGASGPYREAILTTPTCSIDTCHVGDLPYDDRLDGHHLFLNTRVDPFFWTAEEMDRILAELTRHGVVGLESDPLYLALLARHAARIGRSIDVKGFVQLTYAFSSRACLRAIAQAFAGPVLQLYGASEVGVLFMEGDDGLLHHAPFTTHVELLPARVPTPGASDVAMVVVTTLDRVAMPLARFVVGDLVQVAPPGPGRPQRWTSVPPLVSVEGRIDDAIVRPDGSLVTAGALDRALAAVDGIFLWQANQRTPDRVEIDVVATEGSRGVVEGARAAVASLLEGLEVRARSATAIPIEPSGKFRVSKRHFPLDTAACFEGC